MLDILIIIGTGILILSLVYLGVLPKMLERKKKKVTMTTTEEEVYLKNRKIATYVVVIAASVMVLVPFLILYLPVLF